MSVVMAETIKSIPSSFSCAPPVGALYNSCFTKATGREFDQE
jgi:hypothetical protein